MEYTFLPDNELLEILAAQTAIYTDFLTIGALTPKQVRAKKVIDEIVGELNRRKETEKMDHIQRRYEFATANYKTDTSRSASQHAQ